MKRGFLAMLALCCAMPACSPHPIRAGRPTAGGPARGPWLHVAQSGTSKQPLRVVQQLGNRREYDLHASSSESTGGIQGSTIGTFFDTRVTFYARNGRTLIADSSKAIINQKTDSITLVGNVRAKTDSGITLRCDRLRYDQKTQMLHGEGHVMIADSHGLRATGNVIDSDIALSQTVMQ